jgi:hypothetical protein
VSLNSANVRSAVTGAISLAPKGTTAPTDADATLNVAFNDLGYVGEDGVTETRDRSTDTIAAWQRGDIVREIVTEANLTFNFVLIETKRQVVELYYGSEVDPANGSVIIVPSSTGGRQAWVIDVIDGDDFIRTWVPQGEVVEVGDQVYQNGQPIGYECTMRAYPDPSLVAPGGGIGSAKKFYSSLVEAA